MFLPEEELCFADDDDGAFEVAEGCEAPVVDWLVGRRVREDIKVEGSGFYDVITLSFLVDSES